MASNKLFPAGDPRASLIYAHSMAPLAEIPGDVFEGIMQSREQTRLEEARRDQERARREGRRKTRRTEFLESVAAAEGVPATAQTATTTAGKRGVAPAAAGPTYTTTTGPGGHEMVAGMEFGPGKGSPEDITLDSVRPSREATVSGLEERRKAGHLLEQLGRFTERSRGADPTIQERAEEIVRGYGLDSQNATEVAVRESLGEPTPAFDKLVSKKAEKGGFVSPVAKERVRRVDPEGGFGPSSGGRGVSFMEQAPTKKGTFQRAMDAPEQPYGDPYLTPMASAYRESSQAMMVNAMLEGDYLGDQTPERTRQARAYERFVTELGDEEAAEELKRVRKIAWAQQAREKKKFMAAMVPSLRKVKIPNPEAVAELYWDNPEQGKEVYKQAESAYRQVLANYPRVREEDEKRKRAKSLGEGVETSIRSRARTDLIESHKRVLGLTNDQMAGIKEDASEIDAFERGIISRQPTTVDVTGKDLDARARSLRDDRSGNVSEEDKEALRESRDRRKLLDQRRLNLAIDQALLVAETASLKAGDQQVAFDVVVDGKTYKRDALSAGGQLSFNLVGLDKQNAATVYGGAQYVSSTATAAARGGATEDRAYTFPRSVVSKPAPPPKTTRPTGADVNSLARLLTAHGYNQEDAEASAASASANPEFFWSQVDTLRKKKKDGNEEISTGFEEGEKEVRDEDIYLEGSESRAWDEGWRKKVEEPGDAGGWKHEGEGISSSHAAILESYK